MGQMNRRRVAVEQAVRVHTALVLSRAAACAPGQAADLRSRDASKGTMRTGQAAIRVRAIETEPSRAARSGPRPRDPTTMTAAPRSEAQAASASATALAL